MSIQIQCLLSHQHNHMSLSRTYIPNHSSQTSDLVALSVSTAAASEKYLLPKEEKFIKPVSHLSVNFIDQIDYQCQRSQDWVNGTSKVGPHQTLPHPHMQQIKTPLTERKNTITLADTVAARPQNVGLNLRHNFSLLLLLLLILHDMKPGIRLKGKGTAHHQKPTSSAHHLSTLPK